MSKTTFERLLSTDELAEVLGVSRRTIRVLSSNGALPYIRVGRQLRFRLHDVLSATNNGVRVRTRHSSRAVRKDH